MCSSPSLSHYMGCKNKFDQIVFGQQKSTFTFTGHCGHFLGGHEELC